MQSDSVSRVLFLATYRLNLEDLEYKTITFCHGRVCISERESKKFEVELKVK